MKRRTDCYKVTLLFLGTLYSAIVYADDEFNPGFLVGSAVNTRISEAKNTISPGVYKVDVYVNKEWKGNYQLKVAEGNDLFIQKADFFKFDIKTEATSETSPSTNAQGWVLLTLFLKESEFKFRQNTFQLDITVPQARIIMHDKNWMPPEQWDKGITGLFTNYNLIYTDGNYKNSSDQSSLYVTLNSGFNIADWHLRDKSYYYHNKSNSSWITRARYLEKSFPAINSTAKAGEDYTSSDWFDSFKFRGVALIKDLSMLPDSYRLYMPVIRGVAESNAIVKVIQNDKIVFQQSVPAGPFEFADLMPTGSRSDLSLVIEYANGKKTTAIIPYSASGNLLRSGSSDWALYAGKFKSDYYFKNNNFVQAEYSRGLNNSLTIVAGSITGENYQSGLAGAGLLIPYLGTLTTSYQYARAKASGAHARGGKARISLNKYFPTRTSITVSATHNEKNYLTLSQSDSAAQYVSAQTGYRVQEQNSFSAAIDQRLPEGYGSLNASIYATGYWNTSKTSRQFSLGWSNSYNQISWTVNAGRRIYTDSSLLEQEKRTAVYHDESYGSISVSIPWSIFNHNGTITAASNVQGSQHSSSVGWNETVSERLRYNLLASSKSSDRASSSGYVSYTSPWSTLTGNLAQSRNSTQYGFSASGSLLLSQHGLLASPQTGNHFVIIDAPGIADAKVNGNASIVTNSAGKALLPYATPWRKNTLYLNADSASDIEGNIKKVAPWKGSISYVKYITDTRKTFSLRATNSNGAPLTFGASLYDKQGNELGYVAQGGLIHIKADTLPDSIRVQTDKTHACLIEEVVLTGDNICKNL